MANSMVLDAFQLAQGDFLQRYGLSNLSTFDYIKLRAALAASPHSTALAHNIDDVAGTTALGNVVVTGFYFSVTGTNVDGVLRFKNGSTTLFQIPVSTKAGSVGNFLSLDNIEMPATEFTTIDADGSGVYNVVIFGYTPPTSQP